MSFEIDNQFERAVLYMHKFDIDYTYWRVKYGESTKKERVLNPLWITTVKDALSYDFSNINIEDADFIIKTIMSKYRMIDDAISNFKSQLSNK